jgi:hypothetical protein
MNDAASSAPIEIRWSADDNAWRGTLFLMLSLPHVWTILDERHGWTSGTLTAAFAAMAILSFARALDRRPKIVLTERGFSCPRWFIGDVAWSDVDDHGDAAIWERWKYPLLLLLAPEAADRLVWLGALGRLRRIAGWRRAAIMFPSPGLDMSHEALAEIVRTRVAAAGGGRRRRGALPTKANWRLLLSPLYFPELVPLWLAVAAMLFQPPFPLRGILVIGCGAIVFLMCFAPSLLKAHLDRATARAQSPPASSP